MFALCHAARPAVLATTQHRGLSNRVALVPVPVAQPARRSPCAPCSAQAIVASAETTSTAKIVVQGRNISVTQPIKDYAVQKVSKAVHNFEGAVKEVDVNISVRGKSRSTEAHHQRHQIVEVTVYTLRHGVVRVEDEEEDAYAAIDMVTDKLKRKLSKLKEKAVQKNNWPGRGGSKGAPSIEDVLPEEAPDALPTDRVASLPPEIVREKLLILEPMTIEDAVDQLENVGHDFFLFTDAKDGATKVVYRRRSQGYGVLIAASQV